MSDDAIVFIVDDDEAVRQSTAWLIESIGLNVCTFASADEFLEVVDELESGINLDQIARMHGTYRKALEKRLVRLGILRPSPKDKNKLII